MFRSSDVRRPLIAIAIVAAGAAVYGCGGGDAADATPTQTTDTGADVRGTVLIAGRGDGMVAHALKTGLKAGSRSDFDVLVLDANANGEELALADSALEAGKQVVIDGSSEADSALVRKLAGMSVDADAVLVMKASDGQEGYVVVPIDSEARAAARKTALAVGHSTAASDDVTVNTVASVFGL